MAILGDLLLFRITMLASFEVEIKKFRLTILILPSILKIWTIFGQPRRYLTEQYEVSQLITVKSLIDVLHKNARVEIFENLANRRFSKSLF